MTNEQFYKLYYGVAIHEAGHLVVHYLLFGNINIIKSVSLGNDGHSAGRNKEIFVAKTEEVEESLAEVDGSPESIENYCRVGGFAFNECCYSLAGVVADKVHDCLDTVPFENSPDDMESLYQLFDYWTPLYPSDVDSLVEKALPITEKIVRDNFGLITKVAEALLSAPDHKLDNGALQDLLAELTK